MKISANNIIKKLAEDMRKKHWDECKNCEPSDPIVCRICIKGKFIEFVSKWKLSNRKFK